MHKVKNLLQGLNRENNAKALHSTSNKCVNVLVEIWLFTEVSLINIQKVSQNIIDSTRPE